MSNVDLAKIQARLVNAIWSDTNHEFDAKNLEIYRHNLKANAARSLSISFPTIFALVGESFFSALVNKFIENHPLIYGDWGGWGKDFPVWLAQQPSLSGYPYLQDCAILDWQCHIAERLSDDRTETQSNCFRSDMLEHLRLKFATGTQIIRSHYPIVDIWQAHQTKNPEQKECYMELARQKLTNQQGQIALLWRPMWKANLRECDELEARWIELTLENKTVSSALAELNKDDFSLIEWLPKASTEKLICNFTT